jgi:apolipoprotein N-acyltransferase
MGVETRTAAAAAAAAFRVRLARRGQKAAGGLLGLTVELCEVWWVGTRSVVSTVVAPVRFLCCVVCYNMLLRFALVVALVRRCSCLILVCLSVLVSVSRWIFEEPGK